MIYSDGETVTYNYNAGGLLQSMSGKKQSDKYDYVTQLGYDKFEQRVLLSYGNGTKTTYSYEPKRRRLSNMTAKTAAGRAMMDNSYGYDQVNNILSLKNNAEVPNSNLMGGSSEYSYEYDDLYRLTSAEGSFTGSNHEHRYNLEMKYNSVGGILEKVQVHERKGSGDSWQQQKRTSYSQSYEYADSQPHAPIHIGEQKYSYDKNGNQTGWTHDVSGQRRQIVWDEENRIRAIADNGSVQHYIYDASGTRVLKGKSKGQSIYVNSEYKAGSGSMGNYTVYVNPYLVLRSGGYTKHYYIEGQRIVSKLGSGLDNNGKGQLKAGQEKVNYGKKQVDIREGIVKNLKFLGIDGAILTAGNSGKTPPGQLKGGKGGNAGGGKDKASEKFQYFYHPDHLGSSSYITDASGEVYQHLEYFAFGETFVEEHSNTHRTPYLFNGKELDEETGLYYYGARYYDARTSIWLAVDPLAEKYPGWSPYNYTMNNPINLIDPDGRSPGDPSCPECPEYTQITPPISGELAGTPKTFEHSLEGAQYRDNQKTMSPVKNPVISSEFGGRDAPIAGASTDHKGIDIVQAEVGAVEGADVVAPLNGTVIAVKDNNTYPNNAGNRVHMKANKDGKIHSFFHLQDTGFGNDFSAGDKIQRGQKIGQVGNSGNSEAVHLHYEIRDNPGSGAAYSPRFENVGLRNAPNTTQARTRQVVPTYVPFSSEFKGPEF